MAELKRKFILEKALNDAVNEVVSFSSKDFLKCFENACKGKARLTADTKKSLVNIHSIFLPELKNQSFVEFERFSEEKNLFPTCDRIDIQETIISQIKEEEKEEVRLRDQFKQLRKEQDTLYKSLLEVNRNASESSDRLNKSQESYYQCLKETKSNS